MEDKAGVPVEPRANLGVLVCCVVVADDVTGGEGKIIGRCMQRHRHQEFIRFLNAIEADIPAVHDAIYTILRRTLRALSAAAIRCCTITFTIT